MTSQRSPWQLDRDRLVAAIVHDAVQLARAGHDLSNPDWWPCLHRLAANHRALIALAASIGEADKDNAKESDQ